LPYSYFIYFGILSISSLLYHTVELNACMSVCLQISMALFYNFFSLAMMFGFSSVCWLLLRCCATKCLFQTDLPNYDQDYWILCAFL